MTDSVKSQIERAVQHAIAKASGAIQTAQDARDLAKSENDKALGARAQAIVGFANAAAQDGWASDDVQDAIKAALNARNSKNSTVNTFAGELRLAARREVRGHVARFFQTATAAFADEDARAAAAKEAKQPVDTPLRTAFSRAYHAAMAMARAAADGKIIDAGALTEFALATIHARQINFKRVKARLDNIRKELAGFHADFPVDDIEACVELLGTIGEGDLKAAYDAEQRRAGATAARVVDEHPADDDAVAPVEGVVDIEDILSEAA